MLAIITVQDWLTSYTLSKILKKYSPFLWMGFNCHKATEPLWGSSLLFTMNFPESPSTDQPWKDERMSRPWSHPVVLKTGPAHKYTAFWC